MVLSKVREEVNGGRTLGDAMSAHPKVFDTLYVSMIKAGERSGALGQVLERLSKFADESVRLQGQVVSALAYPALMASVGSLMIIGIFVGVLPKMRTIFDSLATARRTCRSSVRSCSGSATSWSLGGGRCRSRCLGASGCSVDGSSPSRGARGSTASS